MKEFRMMVVVAINFFCLLGFLPTLVKLEDAPTADWAKLNPPKKEKDPLFHFFNENPISKRQIHFLNSAQQFPAHQSNGAYYQTYPTTFTNPTVYNSAAAQFSARYYQYPPSVPYAPFTSPAVQYHPSHSYQPYLNTPAIQNTAQQPIHHRQLSAIGFATPGQYPQYHGAAPGYQQKINPLNQRHQNLATFIPPPAQNGGPLHYASQNLATTNHATFSPTIQNQAINNFPTKNPANAIHPSAQNQPVVNFASQNNGIGFQSTAFNKNYGPSSSQYNQPVQWNSGQLRRRTEIQQEELVSVPGYPYGDSDPYQKYLILPTPSTELYENHNNNFVPNNPSHINNNNYNQQLSYDDNSFEPSSIPILAPMAEIVEPEPWDSVENFGSSEDHQLFNPMNHVHWTPQVVRHRVLRPILYGTVAGLSLFAGYSAFIHAASAATVRSKQKRRPAQPSEQAPPPPPPTDIHHGEQMEKIENFIASQQKRRRRG